MSRQTSDELRRIAALLQEQSDRVLGQTEAACRVLGGEPVATPDPNTLEEDIDRQEVALEEDCLRLMALHHPVGGDLRFLVTVLRANGDLERIADHALAVLNAHGRIHGPHADPLNLLSGQVLSMLRHVLSALRDRDPRLAQKVLDEARTLRALAEAAWKAARIRASSGESADLDFAFQEIRIGQDLRRIGDLACNLAEDVLYLDEGLIVRHGGVAGA